MKFTLRVGRSVIAHGKGQFKRKVLAYLKEDLFIAKKAPKKADLPGRLATNAMLSSVCCWTSFPMGVTGGTIQGDMLFKGRHCKAGHGNGLFQGFSKVVAHHNHQGSSGGIKRWGPPPTPYP